MLYLEHRHSCNDLSICVLGLFKVVIKKANFAKAQPVQPSPTTIISCDGNGQTYSLNSYTFDQIECFYTKWMISLNFSRLISLL